VSIDEKLLLDLLSQSVIFSLLRDIAGSREEYGECNEPLLAINDEVARSEHGSAVRDEHERPHEVAGYLLWLEKRLDVAPELLPILLLPGVVPLEHGNYVLVSAPEELLERRTASIRGYTTCSIRCSESCTSAFRESSFWSRVSRKAAHVPNSRRLLRV